MFKKIFQMTIALAILVSFSSCNQNAAPKMESEDDKTIYALGYMFAGKMKDLNLTDKELDLMISGIRDGAKDVKAKVEVEEYQMKIQEFFKNRVAAASEVNKKKGTEYLDKFVKDESAQKTESGLAYKVLKEGTGAAPKEDEEVEVHYHGTLIDGTVFDSSIERGKTVSFPLNRVIRGWTEGLQMVKPGGKIKLVIPSELAYGDHGAPPKIPGGATLVFEVELFKVSKAAAEPAPAAPAKKAEKKK